MPAAVAIPAIAAVVGGALQANGAKKAANTQAEAANQASANSVQAQREAQAFQQRQADQARTDQEPWRIAGTNALSQLAQRTGPGGDLVRGFGMDDFQKDPGYDFRMSEGMKGMNNSAAARGGLLSGAALKEASQYNQNFASNEYGNAASRFRGMQTDAGNRLASLANVGQISATQNGNNSMQLGGQVGNQLIGTANAVGSNLIGAGNARASGYLAQAGAWGNTINQLGSMWTNKAGG